MKTARDRGGHHALIPLQAVNQAGSIAPERAARIATAYTGAFFERHLKGKDAWPSDAASAFPEVRLTVRTGADIAQSQE